MPNAMGEIPPLAFIVVGLILAAIGAWFVVSKMLGEGRHFQSTPDTASKSPVGTKRQRRPLSAVSERLDVPLEYLEAISPSYRETRIPKDGGGSRYLQIPDEKLKQVQKKILRRLLAALNSHPFCYGFEAGTSIVHAAVPHTNRFVVVKMDIRRFFESTSADRVCDYFRFIGWDEAAAKRLAELTTYKGYLPQGAPTSPRLSNLVNFGMDELLASIALAHGGSYSRYADDITMSFDKMSGRRIRGIVQEVRRVLDKFGYVMHGKSKLKIFRRHQRQEVLGLVVNDGVRLPRKTRRWLRAVQHRLETSSSATITADQLDGWLEFERMVERQRLQ